MFSKLTSTVFYRVVFVFISRFFSPSFSPMVDSLICDIINVEQLFEKSRVHNGGKPKNPKALSLPFLRSREVQALGVNFCI